MNLQDRCKAMMEELGIPVTSFCRNIQISTAAYYSWINGKLDLMVDTTARIDRYLSKYGF